MSQSKDTDKAQNQEPSKWEAMAAGFASIASEATDAIARNLKEAGHDLVGRIFEGRPYQVEHEPEPADKDRDGMDR
jgi:hypothetical protein